jgi:HD-GYP domain-containing protein (c-di-GMP phosphodiesterase class II)
MAGHSRRCAELAADAARLLGLSDADVTAVRRAALVHDFGTTAVPNSIWDKPGALTRGVRSRRTAPDADRADAAPLAGARSAEPGGVRAHEKCDGSAYHKRVRADGADPGAGVLAATEIYVGLTPRREPPPRCGRCNTNAL